MVVFDTNILIDQLNGVPDADAAIWQAADRFISVITFLEINRGPPAGLSHAGILLTAFRMLPLDDSVVAETLVVSRSRRLKLPDAIIWATARVHGAIFLTRDDGFPSNDPRVMRPYILV